MIKNPGQMKFIHMTDCHVAANGQAVYGQFPLDRLRRAIDSINCDHFDADFVVITGDLAHRGDDAAYDILAREIGRLTVPSHLLVGNHDDIRSFYFRFPETQRCEHGFVQGSKRTPFGMCLFLDTSLPGTGKGHYCDKRQSWLRRALEETNGPVMLFMHHPPFAIGIPDTDDSMLQQADHFWDILEPHKDRIRHIFVGHAHRMMFGNWRGLSVSGMRGLNHQVALELSRAHEGQSGNAEAPAYGIVLVNSDQVMVHMHDFADESTQFLL